MKSKAIRTNAMRLLDTQKIKYETAEYEVDENDLSGVHLAETAGVDVSVVYKTLVVRGEKTGINVFVIPAAKELDLKRCAAAAGDIRGGCSPVGMKKKYPTFIDSSAFSHERIYVSAGQRGVQLIISPEDLKNAVFAAVGDYVRG
ncbi:MAG: hypothetical protein BHW37_06560 [Firmicutes bacterium CAG:272_52_7]|nr:MAG: hypothetical protein BHW37_06560 [Firmicutes bacterium CAG:272_52_7]